MRWKPRAASPGPLIVGAYDFLPNVDDAATLVRVSKLAAGADAPFISHMRPDILGVHSLYGNAPIREAWKNVSRFGSRKALVDASVRCQSPNTLA